jgi:tRNA wybutosine-synthesizing protein 3
VLARSRVALCGVGTLARMATFDARKALERDAVVLGDAEASARDRSRAGRVDARCEAIVREVFASDDFFTTSSCSGRVSVFAERGRGKREGKGEGGTWAYVSHEPALGEAVAAAVRAHAGEGEEGRSLMVEKMKESLRKSSSTLTLRFEPFILAVEARDLDAGEAFVRCARECGYRESGITASEKRVICAARCQLRLDAPVVVDGERLVSDEGLETLVRLANEKFQVNADRMERFREAFNAMCAKRAAAKAGPSDEGGALKCVEAKKQVAKAVKDALKRGGWLDNARKSATKKNDVGDVECVILPIKRGAETAISSTVTSDAKLVLAAIEAGDVVVCDDGGHVNGGLGLMSAKKTQNPVTQMKQEVAAMLEAKGLNVNLAQEAPTRWEKLGDLVLLPANAFTASDFSAFGAELYACVARVLGASRVARQAPVSQGPKRESRAVMLYPEGADGWVETKELGVTYGLDVTKVMFSSGNGTEKNRMGAVGANGETVVDLFAGIGYYTLQLLKNAGAAKVYACEWNPNSCEALRHNLRVNGVESRCEVLEGDNRRTAPTGVADRVLLGLLPHAEMSWETAIKALKPKGGVLHVHSNVNSGDEDEWMVRLVSELKSLAETNGRGDLDIVVEHLERVKWYGPRIRHVVCDVRCTSRTHKDDLAPTRNMAPKSAVLARQPARTSGTNVRRVHRPLPADFKNTIAAQRVPAVISGLDIGQAPWTWTPSYLASLDGVPEKLVSVHVSRDPKLDFVRKNFKYVVMPFGELLAKVNDASDDNFYYLRSIGENPRKEPAHALLQFPSFARDLKLPSEFWGSEDNYFSAVVRVSSGDLQLWTHYDAMDNMLIQLHGEKRVLLFPPSVSGDLYLEGSSSVVRDVDDHDRESFPRFARARKAALEVILQPGDVLYIPALWAHHVTALHGPSIALNVFFRHLPTSGYPSKDLYGNADPIAAASALKSINSAIESLKELPLDYRVFYAGVAAARLESELGVESARRALATVNDDTPKSRGMNSRATKGTGVVGTVLSALACLLITRRASRK